MLPTNTQFLNSLYSMRAASEQATLAYYFEGNGHNADGYKTRAITELKMAAVALGFELVERLPVTPAARDGGRMEKPELCGFAGVADA